MNKDNKIKTKLINKKIFKRTLAVMLTFTVSIGIVACGTDSERETAINDEKDIVKSNLKVLNEEHLKNLDDSEYVSEDDVESVYSEYKKHYIDYTLELYNTIRKDENIPDGDKINAMISPYSIAVAMGMTSLGARENTKEEIDSFLYGTLGGENGQKCLSVYTNGLKSYKDVTFSKANSIWFDTDSGIKFNDDYFNNVSNLYRCELYGTPFTKNTKDDINNWISDKTNDMINDVIDEIDESCKMVLINAIAFEASWKEEFETAYTAQKDFENSDGENVKVDMMSGDADKYIKDDMSTGFVKRYKEGYSYVAIRPNDGVSVDEYLASLDGEKLLEMLGGAIEADVFIDMPKYSSDSRFELIDSMKKMEINQAFCPAADFSGMYTDSCNGLYIGNVIHQTHIDVDEGGTKAAAVTVVEMDENAACIEENDFFEVNLDRSFIYMIIDDSTNLPVFFGIVEKL